MPWRRHYPNLSDKIILFVPFLMAKAGLIEINTFLSIVKKLNYNFAFCVRLLEMYFGYDNKSAVRKAYFEIWGGK